MPTAPDLAPALRFLDELSQNNEKSWFDQHRSDYETARRAFEQFVDGLIDELRESEQLQGLAAKDCVARIYRDVRFSKDKSPYKTHAALWAFHRDAGRGVGRDAHGGAGFYFHIEPGASLVAGGFWMPPRPLLGRIRERIVDEQRGFEKLVRAPAFTRRFGALSEDDPGVRLTRVPRGFAPDHPAAHWLRFNSFTAHRMLTDAEVLSPRLVDAIMKDYAALLPLVRWLNATLGYPPATAR